jgi:hypothetical protein
MQQLLQIGGLDRSLDGAMLARAHTRQSCDTIRCHSN